MARPQVEEGFVMIALDLFTALLTADIPNGEAILLAEVLSQSYGPQKRRNVHLDLVEMEHRTGVHRNNVRRAIAGLVAANILARNDDGTYWFLKDWEAWKPRGKPFVERLNGSLAMFARNIQARFGKPVRSTKGPIQSDCEINENHNPVRLPTQSSQIEVSAETESNQIAKDHNNLMDKNAITPSDPTSCDFLACAHTGAIARGIELRSLKKLASLPARETEFGSFEDCVIAVADFWGDQNANRLTAHHDKIAGRLNADPDPQTGPCLPRWDCYLAAVDDLARRLKLPGAKAIDDPVFYVIPLAQEFMVNGIPPKPISVGPRPSVPGGRLENQSWKEPDLNEGHDDDA
jgi:hypothetical protein